MKTTSIVLVVALTAFVSGCKQEPEAVVLDPESQRELAEFQRQLDQQTDSLGVGARRANTIPATTDTIDASPAIESSKPSVPVVSNAPPSTVESTSSVPEFSIDNQSELSDMIDNSRTGFEAIDGKQQVASSDNDQFDLSNRDSSRQIPGNKEAQQIEQVTHISGELRTPANDQEWEPNRNVARKPAESVGTISGQDESLARDSQDSGTNVANELIASASGTDEVLFSTLTVKSPADDVCKAFLQSLQNGKQSHAYSMLTNLAQIETSRAKLQLESPGGPDARFEVLPAEYATTEKRVAQVKCMLYSKGESEPVQLSWMMRYQYNGWKISGMAIQLGENGTPDLISFENGRDLQRIVASVDSDQEVSSTRTTAGDNGQNIDIDRR